MRPIRLGFLAENGNLGEDGLPFRKTVTSDQPDSDKPVSSQSGRAVARTDATATCQAAIPTNNNKSALVKIASGKISAAHAPTKIAWHEARRATFCFATSPGKTASAVPMAPPVGESIKSPSRPKLTAT